MVPSVPALALPADSSVWDNSSVIGSPGIDISVTCFKASGLRGTSGDHGGECCNDHGSGTRLHRLPPCIFSGQALATYYHDQTEGRITTTDEARSQSIPEIAIDTRSEKRHC